MNRYDWIRMLTTIGLGVLLGVGIYISHPSWFDSHSVFTLPIVNRPTPPPGPTSSPGRSTATPTPATPRVGMTQHLDDIWITPRRATVSQGTRALAPNLGDEFIVVDLLIRNRSQIDYQVRTADFQVLDSQGELAPALDGDFTRRRLREVRLIPNGRTQGMLIFEVPMHDPAAMLIYQPSAIDPTKYKTWLLP